MSELDLVINATNRGAMQALSQTQGEVKRTANAVESAGGSIDSVFKKLAAGAASLGVAFGAQELTKKIFSVRSAIQALEVSFTTLLGSKSKADELFGSIKKFATTTPMLMDSLASGAQTMLGFGIAVDDIMPNLKALGDISMGDAQKFQSLTLAFSQMTATGKLQGQDLLQMINAGFNPLGEIAKKTGKSIAELKDDMSKGAISAEMVRDAFISATSEGGKFYGMLEAQSKTLNGALSNVQGSLDNVFNEVGKKLEPAFVALLDTAYDSLNKLTEYVETLDFNINVDDVKRFADVIEGVAVTWGAWKAAELAVIAAERVHSVVMGQLQVQMASAKAEGIALNVVEASRIVIISRLKYAMKQLWATMLANPYGVVLAAAAAFVMYLKATTKEIDVELPKINTLADAHEKVADAVGEEKGKLNQLCAVAKDVTKKTSERVAAVKELQSTYPDYFGKLSQEAILAGDTADAYAAVAKNIGAAAEARAAYELLIENEKNAERLREQRAELDGEAAARGKKYAENVKKVANTGYQAYGTAGVSMGQMAEMGLSAKQQEDVAVYKAQKAIDDQLEKISKENDRLSKKAQKDAADIASASTTSGSGKDTAKDTAKKKAQEAQRLADLEETQAKERARRAKDDELAAEDARISGLAEGEEKVRAQIAQNYEKEAEAIRRYEQDAKADAEKAARELWETTHAGDIEKGSTWGNSGAQAEFRKNYTPTEQTTAVIEQRTKANGEIMARALKAIADADAAAWDEWAQRYGDFAQQIEATNRQFEEKLKNASGEGAQKLIKAQWTEALDAIREKFGMTAKTMADLFADTSKKSVSQINEIIDKYTLLVDYLQGKQGGGIVDENGEKAGTGRSVTREQVIAAGISEADLKSVESGVTPIKDVTDALKTLIKTLEDRSPFTAFTKNVKEFAKQIKEAANFEDIGAGLSGLVGEFQNMLPNIKGVGGDIANIFGVDSDENSKFGKAMQGIEGGMNVAQGAAKFMSGDIVGGLMDGIKGISQLVDAFSGSNIERLNAEIETLTESNKNLSASLDDLRSAIDDADVSSVADMYRKGNSILKQQQANASKIMIDEAAKYSQRKHSIGYILNKDADFQEMLKGVTRILGKKVTTSQQFLGLSASDLKTLRLQSPNLYNDILSAFRDAENGKNGEGVDELINDYVNQFADAFDELTDQINQKVTTITFDDVRSNFTSLLSSMGTSSQEWADNFEDMIRGAVVNALTDNYTEDLNKWYEEFAQAMKNDGQIDRAERDALYSHYQEIVENAKQDRDALFDILELTDTASGASGSSGGFSGMGQDTADELNGRFAAIQVITGGIAERMAQYVDTLANIAQTGESSNAILDDLRELAAVRNSYLEDMAADIRKTYFTLNDRLSRIDTNIQNKL